MGLFDKFKKNKSTGSDFRYLKNLIDNGNNIVLDKDIILSDSEVESYPEGITLNRKGMVIDGNGHSIDAGDKTRIFKITSKDVTLKNITLLNGNSDVGGAIYIDKNGSLEIVSSVFKDNRAKNGGAIANHGRLKIKDSEFNNNNALKGSTPSSIKRLITFENKEHWPNIGGAITNFSSIEISESSFIKNKSYFAGAVANFSIMRVMNSNFEENTASQRDGGAILSIEDLSIKDSKFIKNISEYGNAGAILTCKNALISSSYFEDNACNNRSWGPDIYDYIGDLQISDTKFKHSEPIRSGTPHIVIYSVEYRKHCNIIVKEDCTYEDYEGNVNPLNDGFYD